MHFTMEAQKRCRASIPDASIAIDMTAGNGFDSLFLAQCVGFQGTVYALDLQAEAVAKTALRVAEAGYASVVRCIHADHSDLASHVSLEHRGNISCAMFNLGYLPFSDKSVVTQASSTLRALDALEAILAPAGLISILSYVGHPTGLQESQAVEGWIARRASRYRIERLVDESNRASPILWLMRRHAEVIEN
jgi:predicted methyltransferase